MAVRVFVSGENSFHRFARGCHKASHETLDREMRRGLQEAGEDLGHAVRAATDIFMPSGYEELLAARLMTKVEVRSATRMMLTLWARGKLGRREVTRLEDGILRHPVWGRIRELRAQGRYAKKPENIIGGVYVNPWSNTRIRPGFFSVPIKYASPQAFKRLDDALERVLEGIVTTP